MDTWKLATVVDYYFYGHVSCMHDIVYMPNLDCKVFYGNITIINRNNHTGSVDNCLFKFSNEMLDYIVDCALI